MRLEEVITRRRAVETIHEIVHALRATSAGRIQGAQRVVAASDEYYDIVRQALGTVPVDARMRQSKRHNAHIGLLVLSSEQPLCGGLSQNIVEFAERRRSELLKEREHGVRLLVVGRRGARQFAARGVVPYRFEPAATSLRGLRDVVKRMADVLAELYAAGDIDGVRAIYARYISVGEQRPAEEILLPPDLESLGRPPARRHEVFHYLQPEDLLAGLLNEYLLICLYRVVAEMYASEQAARLAAMDAATRSAERMLDRLRSEESRVRQEATTTQVLELIGARFASDEFASGETTGLPR